MTNITAQFIPYRHKFGRHENGPTYHRIKPNGWFNHTFGQDIIIAVNEDFELAIFHPNDLVFLIED